MKRYMIFFLLILLSSFSYSQQGTQLHVRSYNIRNFEGSKSTDLKSLKNILLRQKSDILSVQEIKNATVFSKFIENELGALHYKAAISKCGGFGKQKLGFVYNQKRFKLVTFHEDLSLTGKRPGCNNGSRPGVIGIFDDMVKKQRLALVAVHLKAGSCTKCVEKRFYQLSKLNLMMNSLKKQGFKNIIAIGDFNTTGYNRQTVERAKFKQFVKSQGMQDSATNMRCSAYWRGSNSSDGIEEPSLLDHILVSNDLIKTYKVAKVSNSLHCSRARCRRTSSANLGNTYQNVSDHCMIGVHFR